MQDAKSKKWKKALGQSIVLILFISTMGVLFQFSRAANAASLVMPKATAGGSGAALPYVEMEAHAQTTTGTILGPSYALGNLANDAVDHQAVQLTRSQYVQFTLPQQANSINLRYSIPDSSSGGGINASLSIYINGVKQTNDLQLTSQYSWVYGPPDFSNCNGTDWSNSPGGTPSHQFDEVHALLPQMAAGTTVKLQVDAANTAAWYAIDVADFQEVAAPLTEPAGDISVTDAPYNADPTGKTDSTTAIQNAVNAGESQGKGVWIPQGTYLVTSHIIVNNVTLTGAGSWYSVLGGAPSGGGNGNNVNNGTGVGIYGNDTYNGNASSNVNLSNFAIEGQITNRVDCLQDNGIGGSLNNSTISNVWIEHTKVGMWFDGPFSGLKITGSRIDSTLADGINFHRNITNSSVTQTIIRGTGDDGLAMWSATDNVPATGDSSDTFDHNTVQSPYLANGIAIYGGNGNSVTNDLVSGAEYRGGGIMLDYEDFGNNTAPFAGTTTVSNNTIQYTSGFGDQGIQQFGALMFWADNGSINAPFTVSGNEIDNSQYAAISFDGGNPISNVAMNGDNISGAEFAFSNKVNTITGSASNVTASGLSVGGMESCESSGSWNVTMGSGNSGWSPTPQTCGFPTGTPTPTPPPGTPTPTPPPGTPTPTPTPSPAPTGTLVTAINAGGSASGSYVADTDYNQGNAFSDTSTAIDTSGVASAAPQGVWQTCRWNSSFTYTIPGLTAGHAYTLRLDWAELSFQSAGARVFNVAVNGSSVLSHFDVYATAGYKKALAKTFNVTANSSGQIVIAFTQGGADNPFINGIEVWDPAGGPTPTPTPTPTPKTLVKAINAGGGATGNFVADTGYNQGNAFSDTSTAINTSGMNNPAPQAVWQTCRWNSSFTYTLTGLTAGKSYTLQLDWAELTWHASGQRVFNVAVNSNTVLSNFDVYATAGYKTAVAKQFTVTANSSGQIVIAFTQAGADNPFINGIELYA
ncbi:MAG TPA: malectin domain-containing carbohydrate-binding protein [Ktedonobacteraceae bacterium]|nr:malectin domain-containing carbohydrate-binding protein [Ktedonobacteraceae bacterium]